MTDSFVISYPCFLVADELGAPRAVKREHGHYVCLFTDADNLDRFCEAQYGVPANSLRVFILNAPEELAFLLQQWQPVFEIRRVKHIAFDVTPGKLPVCTLYAKLVKELADCDT